MTDGMNLIDAIHKMVSGQFAGLEKLDGIAPGFADAIKEYADEDGSYRAKGMKNLFAIYILDDENNIRPAGTEFENSKLHIEWADNHKLELACCLPTEKPLQTSEPAALYKISIYTMRFAAREIKNDGSAGESRRYVGVNIRII